MVSVYLQAASGDRDIARRDGLDTIARLIEAKNEADYDEVRAQTLVSAIKAGDLEEAERLIAAGAAVNKAFGL